MKNRAFLTEMLLTAAAVLFCAVWCRFCAPDAVLPVLIAGTVILVMRFLFAAARNRCLLRLTEQIEHMLRHCEDMIPSAYEEGELSLLKTAVLKMARGFQEKQNALRSDHLYLKQSLENLSHQLRTPLTTMTLLLNLLRRPGLSPEQQRQYIQELTALLARMQWQIDMLLKLSSLDAGAVTLEEKPVSCRLLIAAAAEPISVTAELKDIALNTEMIGEPQFSGDFQHSVEALMNLLKNSAEHTPNGGSITIRAEDTPVAVVITVTDTGGGIPEADLPHLFERFYRSGKSGQGGYGIGLAYAKEVITRQGGTIEAHNLSPAGAEFVIRMYHAAV